MIPAHCVTCDLIFDSGLIGGNVRVENLTLSNNSARCPICGGNAPVVEGIFNFAGNTLTLISGPAWTQELFHRVQNLLKNASDSKSNRSEILNELSKIAPEVEKQLRPYEKVPQSLWALLVMIIVLFINQCSTDVKVAVDLNELIDQAVKHTK